MDIDGKFYCPRCMRELENEDACPYCGYVPSDESVASTLCMGTLLNGRYQLGAVIGQGGFGITYAAWDELLGAPVAIKEYFPLDYAVRNTKQSDEVETPESSRTVYLDGMLRFQRESHLLAELQGIPEIVKVLDFFSENNTSYIVMEFIRGVAIDEWVKGKKLSTGEILKLMRPVIDALVSTHRQGVLHRDLTPSNILVREDGTVKLIDFGSATEQGRSKGTVMLTRKYAPIEQYGSEHGAQGPWTDVYGISAVLYALICDEEPQEAVLRVYDDQLKSPRKCGAFLKRYQCAAIMAGLTVKPENRIQSIDEFRSLLYDLPAPEVIRRQKRLIRRLSITAAILFVIIAVVTANFSVGLPLGQGLLYSLRGDGWHVTGELYEKKERTIPEKRLGIWVTQIDGEAFREDETLKSVTVPGSVKTVGDSAFYGCGELEIVRLGEGVKTIGVSSFAECPAVLTITLPQSLISIENTAFFNMPDGASLLVPSDSAAESWAVNSGAGYASGLRYEIDEGGARITAVSACGGHVALPSVLDGHAVTAIADGLQIKDASVVTLPTFLICIPASMFYESEIVEARVGPYLEYIDEYAFCSAERLERINIPNSVRVIDRSAFEKTMSLKTLLLGDGIEEIGIAAFSFSGIENLDLPKSVHSLGSSAFSMSALRHISLPETLKEIPDNCFDSVNLETILLPKALEKIGEYAFADSAIQYIEIPEGVTSIGDSAFYNCAALKLVYAQGEADVALDYMTFYRDSREMVIAAQRGTCWEKAAVDFGFRFSCIEDWATPVAIDEDGTARFEAENLPVNTVVPMYDTDRRTPIKNISIEDRYSAPCGMEVITLPPFMNMIDSETFSDLDRLKTVIATGSIYEVGEVAFDGCISLEEFPFKNLTKIGELAFSFCTSLSEVTLPDSVMEIGYGAFSCNPSLVRVRLPDNPLMVYAEDPFFGTSIREIVIPGSIPYPGNIVYQMNSLEILICEEGTVALYDMLYECPALSEVWLPSTLREMNAVFEPALREIYIYSDTVSIAEDSFMNCRDTVTIHAHPGSTSEALATSQGICFVPLNVNEAMPSSETILQSHTTVVPIN